MTLFLDLIPEPVQIQEIAQYLDKLQFDSNQKNSERNLAYKALVDSHDRLGTVSKLLTEASLVFEKGMEGEIECFFILLATLLLKLEGGKGKEMLHKVLEVLKSDKSGHKKTRLVLMLHMFNLHSNMRWQYTVLIAILEYSLESEQSNAVESMFDSIEDRLKAWALPAEKKRTVYDLILKHIGTSDSTSYYDFSVKYLATYDKEKSISTETKERIKSIIITSIKDPEILRTDALFNLTVVQKLKTDKTYEPVYSLLEIFTCFGYKEYVNFKKDQKNQALLSSSGLDNEKDITKIRLLALTSLASAKDYIPYHEAAQVMGIQEAEVEFMVVEAIVMGVLDARLDQVERLIIVRQAESRYFKMDQWQQIETKIDKCKENLSSLLTVIQNAKSQLATT